MIVEEGRNVPRVGTLESDESARFSRKDASMGPLTVPPDLDEVLDEAWDAASKIPGFLVENEARLLGTIAACLPNTGAIVEIGSFKGKSTVMLAKVSQHYGLGPIVAIDPHNFNSEELREHRTSSDASSFSEFTDNLKAAGVSERVDVRRALSTDVVRDWSSPIRFLWIDGNHSYRGAKADLDGFAPYLVPHGVVALHDALHDFPGPIRVFVEDILRSNRYGASGFTNSIAWSQFRPDDGALFEGQRQALDRVASPLIELVKDGPGLTGIRKAWYKFRRSRVPRAALRPAQWMSLLGSN
jgi:predicted O-methyltransferase YrrM